MRCIQTLTFSILITLLFLSFCPKGSDAEVIDRTVAQVGDKIITLHDIDSFAPSIVREINKLPDSRREEAWSNYLNATLDTMIQSTTIQVAAARLGATVTPSEIEDAIVRMRDENIEFREHVNRILAREKMITPEIRLYAQDELLRSKVVPSLIQRAVVTDYDIYEYVKGDPSMDLGQLEYSVELLFLPDRETFEKFTETLSHSNFDEAAHTVSQDIVRMGWITKTHLVPEMADRIVKMDVGDVSTPIIDEDGRYVVIKLADIRTKSQISDELHASISRTIQGQRINDIYLKWLEKSKKSILVNRYEG